MQKEIQETMKINKLFIGTAGIPHSTINRNVHEGIKQVKKLGLEAMELEFVRQIYLDSKSAVEVKKTAISQDIVLTCHGQYFINLNSLEKAKTEASKQRILKAATIANLAGAWSMVFHAGYYMKQDSSLVYDKIKKELKEVISKLQDEGVGIWIRPETTGKDSQFGNLNEIIKLSQETEQVLPCVDFSHLYTRSIGTENKLSDFRNWMNKLESGLGRECLNNMHIHLSGIEYGNKGETRHLELKESQINYKEIIKAWKEYKIKGVVICESPNLEEDALKIKKEFDN